MPIEFYSTKDPYGEFSNFAAFPIEIDGLIYPTSEHYFQSQKFDDANYREQIRSAPSPMVAARLGRSRAVPLISDWEGIKIDVMRTAVRRKFTTYPELRTFLLETGDDTIIEAAKGDRFWGAGEDGTGLNWLGKILMEVRAELR